MPADFGRYARREYERRWLLRDLPEGLAAGAPAQITDHYLDGTRFRVRERLNSATGETSWKLTQKFPQSDGAHDRVVITNSYLTREEYDVFRRLPGRQLLKCRWLLHCDGDRYAIDVFIGPLEGLILAEREYATHGDLLAASPPPFEGIEVTTRVEFTGGALAGAAAGDLPI